MSHSGEFTDVGADSSSKQLMTASLDGNVFIWDLRYRKEMKALDLVWKPFVRVNVNDHSTLLEGWELLLLINIYLYYFLGSIECYG
jgi:WD40 repeat protein